MNTVSISIDTEKGRIELEGKIRKSGGSWIVTVPSAIHSECGFTPQTPVKFGRVKDGSFSIARTTKEQAETVCRRSGNSVVVTVTDQARMAGMEPGDVTLSVPLTRQHSLTVTQ